MSSPDRIRAPRRPSSRGTTSHRAARLGPEAPAQLELADAHLRLLWRRVEEEAARQDQRAAEDVWDAGTLLYELTLAGEGPEQIAARYPGGADAAREAMCMASATTRLLAGVYGLRRARLGLRLLGHYGLQRLEQLEAVDLPVREASGSPLRFPATAEQLEAALGALEPKKTTRRSAALSRVAPEAVSA